MKASTGGQRRESLGYLVPLFPSGQAVVPPWLCPFPEAGGSFGYPLCYGLSRVPPEIHVKVLTPTTSQRNCICR